MQCGDRNLENLRGKNITAKIWYVDGFEGSNTLSNSWSPGFLWDQHSRQYCMMVRNGIEHSTVWIISQDVRATRRSRV